MITIKTKEEQDIMREGGKRLKKVHDEIKKHINVGVTAKAIDEIAYNTIKSLDAVHFHRL